MACKGAKVGSWNSKSLTFFDGVELNPDIQEAHALAGWWSSQGQQQSLRALSVAGGGGAGSKPSPQIVFSDVEDRALGLNQQPDFFTVRCRVQHIKTDKKTLWYIACPDCKKKVQGADEHNLEGSCEKCNNTVTGAPSLTPTLRLTLTRILTRRAPMDHLCAVRRRLRQPDRVLLRRHGLPAAGQQDGRRARPDETQRGEPVVRR